MIFLVPLLGACIAPMSTFHTGSTVPDNRFELNGGIGLNVDSSFIGGTVDAGRIVADKASEAIEEGEVPSTTLTDQEQADLARAALAYALTSPMPVEEIGLRYGLSRRTEIGGTWTSSGFSLHGKYQILGPRLHADDPMDLSVALQYQHQAWSLPIPGWLSAVLDIEDMSRNDLVVPVIAGHTWGDVGFLYGGPKAFLSFIRADLLEKVTDLAGTSSDASGLLWGGGGVIGGGVGYRYVFLLLEVNVVGYSFRPELLGEEISFTGVDVYPAIGLRGKLYDPRKVGRKGGREGDGKKKKQGREG